MEHFQMTYSTSMRVLMILLISLLTAGCGERIAFTEAKLEEYSELKVFLLDYRKIEGTINMDTNDVEVLFETSLEPDDYFSTVEQDAIKEGWKLLFKRSDKSVFYKEVEVYQGTPDIVIVEVTFFKPTAFILRVK